MTDLLVEENFVHIDTIDMDVIIALLSAAALKAGPTVARRVSEPRAWILVMHWSGVGPVPTAVGEALAGVFARVHRYFTAWGKVAPARMTVYGPDGEPVHHIDADPAVY
jgi:hypothetical protein